MILNPKLLIVDDERGIVDMIQSYFQTQYDILTAYSGQEALKKVACKPDLILLDINMPGMDGLTVCQQIREHIACPILFLTARIESSDKIIGFQAGADDYIVKPFDLDELGARIAAHLRREQRRQNNSAVRFFGELILDCQHFFRQIFLGYFSDIVQAFDTLRKNVCGDDYTSLHNPIVLSSVLPAYGMFHSIQILFL